MRSKKFLIVLFSIIIAFVIGITIIVKSNTNVCENYLVDIAVDENGNIDVTETVVIDYKSYCNYLLRDIKYSKPNRTKKPYNQFPYLSYTGDLASFEKSDGMVNVKVYRGDLLSAETVSDVTDITNNVNIGYSWANGTYYSEEYGTCDTRCEVTHECVCISVDASRAGTLTGVMTFEYQYTIYDMVTRYNDCAELNYKVFEYFGMKVKNASVTYHLPNQVASKEDIFCYGHGLSNGSVEIVNNQTISYLAKNISPDEEFECRIVFPGEILDNVSTTDSNYINLSLKDKIINMEKEQADLDRLQATVAIIFNIVTLVIVVLMIFITIRVYKKYDKEFIPVFDKEYLREIPYDYSPGVMSYLYYFGKTNDEDVTATLLDLIRRGYLELETVGSVNADDPEFTIHLVGSKKDEMASTLLPHEKQLISWFIGTIGDGEQVTISQIESYGKNYKQAEKFQKDGVDFQKKIKESASSHDFFINTIKDKQKASVYGLIPLITIGVLVIIWVLWQIEFTWNWVVLGLVTLFYYIYVASIKKRSHNGNEEYAHWKAFKKFLEDFGNFKDYPMPGIIVWEHFLVYATSFKIADKVMEQLKVKLPEMPDEGTYMSSRYYGGNRIYIINTFTRVNTSISRARLNTINSIAAHNARSSGSGHGGGFSGGSSFGGGGGGFRSGR